MPTKIHIPVGRVKSLTQLHAQVAACDRCERLRTYCGEVAHTKRRAYADWDYWGRPVPGFGDPRAWLWIIGLAPAAHGANRTGRVFTGDRSGDFLFAALHRAGMANQPHSVSTTDGLKLSGCYISATARCAPPGNKPTIEEVAACASFLDAEWRLLKQTRVLFALGKIAWDAAIDLAARNGVNVAGMRARFAHGAQVELTNRLTLIGSYHVSQQNTFTGRLTEKMFDDVLSSAKQRTSPRASAR
jgi:uracil-DNA glycosylase family 4